MKGIRIDQFEEISAKIGVYATVLTVVGIRLGHVSGVCAQASRQLASFSAVHALVSLRFSSIGSASCLDFLFHQDKYTAKYQNKKTSTTFLALQCAQRTSRRLWGRGLDHQTLSITPMAYALQAPRSLGGNTERPSFPESQRPGIPAFWRPSFLAY